MNFRFYTIRKRHNYFYSFNSMVISGLYQTGDLEPVAEAINADKQYLNYVRDKVNNSLFNMWEITTNQVTTLDLFHWLLIELMTSNNVVSWSVNTDSILSVSGLGSEPWEPMKLYPQ